MKKIYLLTLMLSCFVGIYVINNPGYNNEQKTIENSNIDVMRRMGVFDLPTDNTDSGGGSSNNLIATTSTSINSIMNHTKNTIYSSERWWVGAITHLFEYEITSIKKYNGVYSRFFDYMTKSVLESGSGSAILDNSVQYYTSVGQTIHFTQSLDYKLETAIYTKAGVSYGNITENSVINQKAGADLTYLYEYTSTRKEIDLRSSTETYSLNQNSAQYCPTGYAMSIGQVGVYYKITLKYSEYEEWWWGKYIVNGNGNKTIDLLICNEIDLFTAFVFRQSNASDTTYVTYYLP